jgi:hypothetical protein
MSKWSEVTEMDGIGAVGPIYSSTHLPIYTLPHAPCPMQLTVRALSAFILN